MKGSSAKRFLGVILSFCMLFSQFVFVNGTYAADDRISITKSKGWHESAYIQWDKFNGADSYNVYVKPSQGGIYTKIDDELIREYDGYFRADVVGLAAGSYLLKAVPVKDGKEITASESPEITVNVDNYVREGFAFSDSSPYKKATGAYNDDGTLRSDADVLYVSNENKDTVMLNNDPKYGEGLTQILAYREKNKVKTPLSIRLIGKVEMPAGVTNYMLGIKETQNVTFEGIGNDATVHGWGLTMKRACNIDVRNIGIMLYGGIGGDGDSLSLDTENKNIFMHNIDFFYGEQGKDADQKKGDGSIDLKARSDYITASYNHFWDSGKTCVAGGVWEAKNPDNPEAKIFVTYHHNWFDHSDSRHPRCVAGNVHVYNNYYDGVGDYGIGAAVQSSVFAENNYFRNVPRPMIIASQGSECYDSSTGIYKDEGSLSGQTGGMIKEYGNIFVTPRRFINQNNVPEGHDPVEIDAYSVSSRDEKVPDTVKAKKGGSTYSNFDTDPSMYKYNVETAEQAVESVKADAGRLDGGDFKWTFNNAVDDKSKDLDEALKAALVNYEDNIVTLYGTATGGTQGGATETTTVDDENTETTTASTHENTETTTASSSKPGYTSSREWNFDTNPELYNWSYGTSKSHTTADGLTFNGNSNSDMIKNDGTDGSKTGVRYLWYNGGGKADTRNIVIADCNVGDIIKVWYGASSNRKITVTNGTASSDFVKTGAVTTMSTEPVEITVTAKGNVVFYASGNIGYYKIAVYPKSGSTGAETTEATTLAPSESSTAAETTTKADQTTAETTQTTTEAEKQTTTKVTTEATTETTTLTTVDTTTETTTKATDSGSGADVKAELSGNNGISFVAGVDSLDYSQVGFIFEADGKIVRKSTNVVYSSINNSSIDTDDLNAKCIYAFTITDIPNDNTDIKVTPFRIDTKGNEIKLQTAVYSINSLKMSVNDATKSAVLPKIADAIIGIGKEDV